jgi:hypothetical protein
VQSLSFSDTPCTWRYQKGIFLYTQDGGKNIAPKSESWNNLIDPYEAWNKPEQAKECRAKPVQVEDLEE